MILLLFACSDYELDANRDRPGKEGTPRLVVDPERLEFEPAPFGQVQTQTVTFSNIGDGSLHINSVEFTGSTAFSHTGDSALLRPGEEVVVEVSFDPIEQESVGSVWLDTDDEGARTVDVELLGWGLIPELELVTTNLGEVTVGCEKEGEAVLTNTGAAPLTVDAITMYGEGFSIEDPGPLQLEIGESLSLPYYGFVNDLGVFSGTVEVEHDGWGDTLSQVEGTGLAPWTVEDTWFQGGWGRSDVFVYVDRSGSMSDDTNTLATNLPVLAEKLLEYEGDWQIGIATRDDGCFNTGILNADTPNLGTAFTEGAFQAGGTYTEAGFTVAANGVGAGCNQGFLREGSHLVLILVSDEPEQSPSDWNTMLGRLQAFEPTVTVNAVIHPGSAGYSEVALATSGMSLNIAGDWGSDLELMAQTITGERHERLELQYPPDLDTLEVRVDDKAFWAWTLDQDANEIVFNPGYVPLPGSIIDVAYTVTFCDG